MKKRIAILGGGMSALVTALKLVDADTDGDKLDITVYQQGWRLGGKGASGRNHAEHERIEEHGLHLMFGFYENVFRVMRHAYANTSGNPDEWKKHFSSADVGVAMMERTGGRWEPWEVGFPHQDGLEPGDGRDFPTHPWFFVQNLIAWLHRSRPAVVRTAAQTVVDAWLPSDPARRRRHIHRLTNEPRLLHWMLSKLAAVSHVHAFPAVARRLVEALPGDPIAEDYAGADEDRQSLRSLARGFAEWLWERDAELRHLALLADLAAAVITGLTIDRPSDWFELDTHDFREWLRKHGARQETVDSPPVAALYAAIFSSYAGVGAGTILQALLRASFTFKGSVVWKMNGGMGDVIFRPLYQYLRSKNVRFEFFHQVKRLELSDDKRCIERIRLERQVDLKQKTYEPLDRNGHWPNQPDWDQLDPAQATKLRAAGIDLENAWSGWDSGKVRTLARGAAGDDGFDLVVLGISVGALSSICEELVDDRYNAPFRNMLLGVTTTATEAAQLWLKGDRLGAPQPIVIPYVDPYDTVADMSHLIAHESWPAGEVGRIEYLCSALKEESDPPPPGRHDYPAQMKAQAERDLDEWLAGPARVVWPAYDPANVRSRYVNVPLNLSDRYVLATPGSNFVRLGANQSGYENLYLTGDWIRNALSVGCLESATMGGIQTARALLAGTPELMPLVARVPLAAGDWLGDPRPRIVSRATIDPPYIDRDGDLLARPPIELKVRLFMFLLEADMGRLERVCDLQLNQLKPKGRYQPFGPMAVLYCSSLDNIVEPFGDCSERDFGLWLPVVHELEGVHRLLTLTPYIWVDNGIALVGGRSLFGFPKQIGKLSLPQADGDPCAFSIDCLVQPQRGGPALERRLLDITRTGGAPYMRPTTSWEALPGMLEAFARRVLFHGGLKNVSWEMVRDFVMKDRGLRGVFLKQLANAGVDGGACYQALIEGLIQITGDVKGGALPGDWDVQIRSYASHQIEQTLGLVSTGAADGASRFRPIAQGWMEFTAMVEPGVVVHRTSY
jgi:uncharacterized protein with NAD-binding domain and iron-sulfur cluster